MTTTIAVEEPANPTFLISRGPTQPRQLKIQMVMALNTIILTSMLISPCLLQQKEKSDGIT